MKKGNKPEGTQIAFQVPFWLAGVALIGWASLVRLPFGLAPRSDPDSALFWIIGHGWRQGYLPYVALWDVKPPGIFLIFAGADTLLGADPFGGRILAAIAIGIGAAGLYRIGEGVLDNRRAGLLAALLFPTYSILLNGLDIKAELFAAPLLIWGILISVKTERSVLHFLFAGTLMGAATMLKQTACFEILFVLTLFATARSDVRVYAAFVTGLLLVPTGFAFYFVTNGALGDFISASLIGGLSRLHGSGIPLEAAPVRLLASLKPALPLLVLTGMGWAERRRIGWTGHRTGPMIMWGWLAAAAFGDLAMRATYPPYALPLLAPLCLASGQTLAALGRADDRLWRRAATTLLAIALLCPIILSMLLPDPEIDPQPPRVAAYLQQHLPGQPVYVVDYEPVVYQLSGAQVPTRFPLPLHLMCDFPALPVPPEDELRRIIATRPAALIFAPANYRMSCELPARVDLVRQMAEQANYRPTVSIDGPAGPVEIWMTLDTARADPKP